MLDAILAVLIYPLYLFCNFSGACDMAVGLSGVMGIVIMENFDRPFAARNPKELWTRWHISLTTFLRDMMFTPMVKVLARRFGQRHIHHIIAFSIVSVFVVIGCGTVLDWVCRIWCLEWHRRRCRPLRIDLSQEATW